MCLLTLTLNSFYYFISSFYGKRHQNIAIKQVKLVEKLFVAL